MSLRNRMSVFTVGTPEDRERALDVLQAVYSGEKGWIAEREKMLPLEDLERDDVTWFAVTIDDRIVGVTRVLYAIPLELYREYGFKLTDPSLDVEAFVRSNRIAEVGRFAVLPKYRSKFFVSALLMRATGSAAFERGFTHFITDVFEEDPNTPYGFHRRVLGFKVVATHDVGELNCRSRRIAMLLDLNEARERLSCRKGWFYRFLGKDALQAAPVW